MRRVGLAVFFFCYTTPLLAGHAVENHRGVTRPRASRGANEPFEGVRVRRQTRVRRDEKRERTNVEMSFDQKGDKETTYCLPAVLTALGMEEWLPVQDRSLFNPNDRPKIIYRRGIEEPLRIPPPSQEDFEKKKQSILSLGESNGQFLKKAFEKDMDFVGLDLGYPLKPYWQTSESPAKYYGYLSDNTKILRADATNLPSPLRNNFDLVVSHALTVNLNPAAQRDVINQAFASAKVGAQVRITIPEDSLEENLKLFADLPSNGYQLEIHEGKPVFKQARPGTKSECFDLNFGGEGKTFRTLVLVKKADFTGAIPRNQKGQSYPFSSGASDGASERGSSVSGPAMRDNKAN